MATILVVDDEDFFRTLLSEMLSDEGYTVETAEDGKSGIEAVHALHPDLILLDMSMPEMTGFDVTRILKNDDKTKDIPILAVTAANTSADMEEFHELGGDRHMGKPISADTLLEIVKDLLQE